MLNAALDAISKLLDAPQLFELTSDASFTASLSDSDTRQLEAFSETLVATVGSSDTTDAAFWKSKCASVPASAAYITVTMGSVKDRFRPKAGETYCSMLVSNNKHQWWDPAAGVWKTPGYFSANFGGSSAYWPKNNVNGDDRKYLGIWGTAAAGQGGCCHNSKTDDHEWNRAFEMHWVAGNAIPPQRKTFLFCFSKF